MVWGGREGGGGGTGVDGGDIPGGVDLELEAWEEGSGGDGIFVYQSHAGFHSVWRT